MLMLMLCSGMAFYTDSVGWQGDRVLWRVIHMTHDVIRKQEEYTRGVSIQEECYTYEIRCYTYTRGVLYV